MVLSKTFKKSKTLLARENIKRSILISERHCDTQPQRRPSMPCSAAVWLWPDQGSYSKNVDFYKVFKGFWRNNKISGTAPMSTSRGQWAPVNSKQRHLENTRFSKGFHAPPRGIRSPRRGPLRVSGGFVMDLIVKTLVFTRFLKGFGETIRFSRKL